MRYFQRHILRRTHPRHTSQSRGRVRTDERLTSSVAGFHEPAVRTTYPRIWRRILPRSESQSRCKSVAMNKWNRPRPSTHPLRTQFPEVQSPCYAYCTGGRPHALSTRRSDYVLGRYRSFLHRFLCKLVKFFSPIQLCSRHLLAFLLDSSVTAISF